MASDEQFAAQSEEIIRPGCISAAQAPFDDALDGAQKLRDEDLP